MGCDLVQYWMEYMLQVVQQQDNNLLVLKEVFCVCICEWRETNMHEYCVSYAFTAYLY